MSTYTADQIRLSRRFAGSAVAEASAPFAAAAAVGLFAAVAFAAAESSR